MENKLPNRKTIRLQNYDYSQAGYYFVTICTDNKQHILGEIIVGDAALGVPEFATAYTRLTETGDIAQKYLQNINIVYSNAKLDCYVIMPNHIHCIIIIENNENNGRPRAAAPTSLPQIINSFKTITSKKCGKSLWQRSYFERIIRNDTELQEIREYIVNNPAKWELDNYYMD